MKKEINKVLLLGSGALKIGEAGEFDYSGSQALKAMHEEGKYTVLINPNIATVQTSEDVADKIYYLPVTEEFVEKVIEQERPDGILLSFGGQTALNCGVELYKKGVLERYGVEVLGTPVQAIIDTEDRKLFSEKLAEIGVKTPRSIACATMEEAKAAARELGFPLIIRAAYTLGGLGSGFCKNDEELEKIVASAFSYSPQVLIEKSLKGWKEVEYEVVRDCYDNCITVCNMENFDPLGIHTGESLVVAPSQTLTNSEYHKLRAIAIRIIRHIGIVGECNVQYALDPESEDYCVIEVNARLSRSSALASKATGYPLAFVAAKLGLGYGLHEIKNSVTKVTSACFEPALDYVVCKIPRWDLNKFDGVSKLLGSSMKSVGEVMSIGRTFEEAIQKGLRMVGQGKHGFVGNKPVEVDIDEELEHPTDKRVYAIAEAFEQGYTIDQVYERTRIDRWFLQRLYRIHLYKNVLRGYDGDGSQPLPADVLHEAKRMGFSDFQIAELTMSRSTLPMFERMMSVRRRRLELGIRPCVKQIDTLAGEYPAQTNYLYLTYNGTKNDIEYEHDHRSVIVLGSGAYRIGSSVEFDWCGVNTLKTLTQVGLRSVMINYNPETVSTDYDVCDRLYFDELTFERVMDIIELESPYGVVVSTGGQIPNNLAMPLYRQGVNILGTSAESIDRAEDRGKFSSMCDALGIDQPRWRELTTMQSIYDFVDEVGLPVLIRPSYVLSGAAMHVVYERDELDRYLGQAAEVSSDHPVVVSEFIDHAKEIEMDAVAQRGVIKVSAISEHVEFAGVHSGDATIVFPAQRLYLETIRQIKHIAEKIARELNVSGPFNIQFLAKDNHVKVIECNLRASRSFPFVSKIMKFNFITMATRVMLGRAVESHPKSMFDIDYVGVKSSQFSFARLQNADPVLSVDMTSTGEVACIGDSYYEALLKSLLSVGQAIPKHNVLISSGPARSKVELLSATEMLLKYGFKVYATAGSAEFLFQHGVKDIEVLGWPDEEGAPTVIDYIKQKRIDLVINIPKNQTRRELDNGYKIRRAAIDFNIPLLTNARLASSFIMAVCLVGDKGLAIRSWGSY
ncbi:MAG: carbamoyl-phosphate synthase (glutamine-hydrolyzing) large subunit [Alistipes sp.]|nr:carbamoyl-phosphate synthase (glutamine-hydrolyzing) large subunit [Alistipes sp.]